jgi:hypothetical protein
MNLQPVAVEQRVDLTNGRVDNFLVMRLPNGKETRAPVDTETVQELIAEMTGDRTANPEPATAVATAEVSAPAEPEEEKIDWRLIPNNELPLLVKTALKELAVPDMLTPTMLNTMVQQLTERFGDEDWAHVREIMEAESKAPAQPPVEAPAPDPPPVIKAPPPAAPPVGQVQWADGSPIAPSASAPMRTVPKDDKGYPIVGGLVDPGAVVGGTGTDEDGVGSI